jgi:hypothetical protein
MNNTDGLNNTATGNGALPFNTEGSENTATGLSALGSNITGYANTATGRNALFSNNGSYNIAFGVASGNNHATGDNNVYIGNVGSDGESNTIRIGEPVAATVAPFTLQAHTATFIAGINGVDKSSGAAVFIDANGQLGTGSASPRGSVVMLPVSGGVAPAAPAGYSFKGFILLMAKANGGGATTSFAVYTKN